MANGPVARDMEQVLRFVQRTWHQKNGRLTLLAAFTVFAVLLWSMTSSVCPSRLLLC